MRSDRRTHVPFDNKPTRRSDDYRPATLRSFWKSLQHLSWGYGGLMGWMMAMLLAAVVVAGIYLSIEVLAPIVRRLIG